MQANELIDLVKTYNPDINIKGLTDAFQFSAKAHRHQKRQSGKEYFEHPLAVAQLLTEKKMDAATIITALLHDTVEDTNITLQDIKKNFGEEVSFLVDGLTKISHLEESEREIKDSENLRKLLLASIGDIRVLIVKLADRLHNMRTLHDKQSPESRHRIAEHSLEIYVPLAERVGLRRWAEELASLAFRELHPASFEIIDKRRQFIHNEKEVKNITTTLEKLLESENIAGKIQFRLKDHWSIYKKMRKKQSQMEDLADIMAFRIIVPTTKECYLTLWLLHQHYKTIPTRLKDYISTPKNNGYQSIHTVIIGPHDKKIEVQIRTNEMDNFAENGLASHWLYKHQHTACSMAEKKKYQRYHDAALAWLKDFFTAIEEQKFDQLSFLNDSRTFLYSDRIYVSSPKGDLYELPIDALPFDFAFAVHTDVGERFQRALVNGREVSFYTKLKNGDTVEIITEKNPIVPNPHWAQWVKTARAKAFITRKLKNQKEQDYLVQGRDLLKASAIRFGIITADHEGEWQVNLQKIYKKFGITNDNQLFRRIALGDIQAKEILFALYPSLKRVSAFEQRDEQKKNTATDIVNIATDISHFTKDISLKYPECCYPLPGDRITGVMNLGEGVTIHRLDCKKLLPFRHLPERIIPLEWRKTSRHNEFFTARLALILQNKPGALHLVTEALTKAGSNISDLVFKTRKQKQVELTMDIDVFNLKQLKDIIEQIKSAGKDMVVDIKRQGD